MRCSGKLGCWPKRTQREFHLSRCYSFWLTISSLTITRHSSGFFSLLSGIDYGKQTLILFLDRVDEIIRRRAITEQVEDRVNLDKVRSLFRMIYCRKKFLAKMEEKRCGWRNTGMVA